MEQKLTVGIYNLSLAWQTVLDQIGVSYSEIPGGEDLVPAQYSLVIINKRVGKAERENIRNYIKNGGACIDEGYCVETFANGIIHKKRVGFIVADNLPFEPSPGIIDIYSKVNTFSKAQYLDKTLFIDSYEQGMVSFLGLPVDSLLFDSRTKRKEFYSQTSRFPNEEVSRVSKGEITRLIFFLMRYLHISRGLFFAHKWFFPGQAKNVFMFRIDSDYGKEEQIKKWYEMAQTYNMRYTWFLHVSAHEKWLKTFSEFKDHEIAVHCYDHVTSKSFTKQLRNIEKATELLQKEGIPFSGYSSPYGLWNRGFNAACEQIGFQYSSEFSYIYDSLPLHPVVENKKSSVLQIPVHPICTGCLHNAKATEKDILAYFTRAFQSHMTVHNPLVFYDHVLHDYLDVVREMFTYIQNLGIDVVTFSEYADWWLTRESSHFSVSVDSVDAVRINASANGNNCFLCIWTDNDTYFLTDSNDTINPFTCQSNTVTYKSYVDTNELKKTRTFKLRLYKYSLFNRLFWRKHR
jgi:hypothetical protein